MTDSKDAVDGTISVDRKRTDIESHEVVFRVRTADDTDIKVVTSEAATEQLRNGINSALGDGD